ncbi:MAG: hypothetical protein Fur002_22890 [Anaerolineales bacterium]
MKQFTRRDFLKTAAATLGGAAFSTGLSALGWKDAARPNIIVILMDALSARHMSLYGYPRLTTPNIDSFSQRATVYHNHISGGNYTTPGTASMLTGMYPWKHGATIGGGFVRERFASINPYRLLGGEYRRFAFAQNTWADRLLGQYASDIDVFLSPFSYTLMSRDPLLWTFPKDRAMGSLAMGDFLFTIDGTQALPGSLALGYLSKVGRKSAVLNQINKVYPKGLPTVMNDIPYKNEEVYNGVYEQISSLAEQPDPFFAYFHLFSPHGPCRPRNNYRKLFAKDGFTPPEKAPHPLQDIAALPYLKTADLLQRERNLYDSQIAQIDDEFGKLIRRLEEVGALENSYVVLTADHGELFERGYWGHGEIFMYEGATHIPLLIRAPEQNQRRDIFSLTSNADLLPTLLSIAGKEIPAEIEGQPLPNFGGQEDKNRAVFSMYARENSVFAPMTKAALSIYKGSKKLIAYLGYSEAQFFELYDLREDPEEMKNIAAKDDAAFKALKDELFAALHTANQLFQT